jgi:hypothetical protein
MIKEYKSSQGMLIDICLQYAKPAHIMYSNPATICYFPDGTKTVVKCSADETYIPEYGVMACIVKKIYGSRAQFLKTVDNGYNQKEWQKC